MRLNAEILRQRRTGYFAFNVITYYCKVSILYFNLDITETNENICLLSFEEDFWGTEINAHYSEGRSKSYEAPHVSGILHKKWEEGEKQNEGWGHAGAFRVP